MQKQLASDLFEVFGRTHPSDEKFNDRAGLVEAEQMRYSGGPGGGELSGGQLGKDAVEGCEPA